MSLVSKTVVPKFRQKTRVNQKAELAHLQGFVSATSMFPVDEHGSRLKGMLVPGEVHTRIFNRHIRIDNKAPAWFKEAIDNQEKLLTELSDDDLQKFRVRVTGWSESGKTAWVTPVAKTFEHAVKEYDRELSAIAAQPKKVADCVNWREVAMLAYQTYAKNNDLTIVRPLQPEEPDDQLDNVVVLYRDGISLAYLSGAQAIWLFTDGIQKGATTFEEEIDRFIKVTAIS